MPSYLLNIFLFYAFIAHVQVSINHRTKWFFSFFLLVDISDRILCFSLVAIYVPIFYLQLLLSYGIADRKGVLSDNEVLLSAKCQVSIYHF